ncbi:putative membrane-anchored protein [Duganella sp. 1224]|uniref:GDYXXLXY domain-containing protein n=1 Tax=Duganella sp. 1224 TaxID=2587052 RepID=UPI0015C73EE6|nr:GDYXXLXY domain-containing protein [Duganella sp. 1224]NYE61215.1 putative membrane-anchored protein [Duganella sp. 1224]
MSLERLNSLVEAAAERGILQRDATTATSARPWPLVLLTALGAWLAAIPFIVALGMLFGSQLQSGAPIYVIGALIYGSSLFLLRWGSHSKFVEQLGLPALLAGSILLAAGIYRDVPGTSGIAALTLLFVAAAWIAPQIWLRALLGALTCAAFIAMLSVDQLFDLLRLFPGLHGALVAWLVALIWLDSKSISGANARDIIALDAFASGWGAMLLLAFAWSAGKAFVVGALVGSFHGHIQEFTSAPTQRGLSVLLAGAGVAWLARHWTAFGARHMALAAVLLLALCWALPLLGGPFLILAVCTTSARPLLATAAAVSAAWIIGAFYYQLNMELADKALILTAIGAALGLIGWLKWQRQSRSSTHATPFPKLMALSLLAILVVVNGGIWQKESLIRNGRPVYIELAPVDPRSLMQGDYMRLNFLMPDLSTVSRHVKVVAAIDNRGIAIVQRIASAGVPLAPNEILIELVNTGSGLRPASDAWYFKEGEENRWAGAKYGEFRVDGSGRALLVNLRGPALQAL